jgi:uncharacterized membrane protein YphA (DoxX/SURF4 family)
MEITGCFISTKIKNQKIKSKRMKKSKTLHWIITGIFSAFMISTSIPDVLIVPDAITFMNHLGYPNYFIPFIGVAKILGSIAILIPGFPRIKEWAYAGLFFDLIGAVYSVVATDGFGPGVLFILLPIGFLFGSYFLYHKKIQLMQSNIPGGSI